ncbi:diguanylate kinase signaling protein [Clostridioides difficile]|nr:diguanylate kinase signaling protein [Clostridioides difficile]
MENNLRKNNSIMKKMIFPLIIVMLIQTSLFCATILWGGTIKKLNDNSFDILNERVINRKNYIQNEMLQRWSNTSETEATINSSVKKILNEKNALIEDVGNNEEINKDIIKSISNDLIYLLRKNSVTGAFIILSDKNINDKSIDSKGEISRTGLYIRDLDPKFNPNDNSDLLIERGSSDIARSFGISMDSYWEPKFSFKSENEQEGDDFFYKPFRAAIDNPNVSSSNLGYWGSKFLLTNAGDRLMTYTVPLIYEDGTVYGVLGIDLSVNYLRELLPYSEINGNKKGNYILGVDRNNDMAFENVISNGYSLKEKFWDGLHSNLEQKESYKNIYKIKNKDNECGNGNIYASVQYLDLYNSNTPFENERWALLGIIEEKSLLSFSKRIEKLVIISIAISLLIGLIGIYIASRLFTKPIVLLANKVRNSNPSKPVNLDKINISEIDELSSAIELLSANVADSSSKLSQIIEMVDMPIGAFELYKNAENVFCTKEFFSVFTTEIKFEEYGYMEKNKFLKKLRGLDKYLQESYETENTYIYKFESKDKKLKWIRMNIFEDELKVLGVVVDVTKEFIEKRKIEYERDFDILTNLLNRRAFHSQIQEKFKNKDELKIAAFIMWDLDNLKYINDTYGHDAGDEYIRCAADILKKFISWNGIVSRLSGDEFYVFIYGYESKDSIRDIINSVKKQMNNTLLKLHDGTEFKIRASAGISWYPDDSTNYDELMRYADFAMYQIKNTIKGGNYILGVDRNNDMAFENVISNGYSLKEKFWDGLHSNLEQKESYKNIYKIKNKDNECGNGNIYASVQYLDLYNSNTPFENERWALLGIIEEKSLLSFSKRIEKLVIISIAISLLIGLIGIYIASRLFTKPIVLLANKVRNSNPSKPVNLDKINISEIDELSSAIELLSANVADSSSKLSQIIEMVDMPIGAFELYKNAENVFCTKDKKLKWIRMNIFEDELKVLGVVVDVTKEFIEKRKIEYERDFDILTNLLNRRAFHSQIQEKFKNKDELKIAAFIMWDLDNLKYINDTYGHDAGDEYIRCAADILKKFISWNGIVSRLSGDEFYVFIYGYESKDSIRDIINSVKKQMNNTLLKLHDGTEFKIRASAGISWYPDDSTNYDELMRYADFAMYQIKNTIKGEVSEFDINIYNKDSFLLSNREELNKLIDGQLVEYAFQPIVDCKGKVFAYEALMRPKIKTFSSPIDVIRLARSQSKLYQIERITWFKALKSFKKYKEKFGDCKLFLNSIPNNNLSKVDFEEIEDLYGEYLNRVVLEITENDKINEDFIEKKKAYIDHWNIEIALDDFGTGYNGDAVLLYIMPDYVKIDMSIVRGIDKDENRQKILKNLISYSNERNIKVIAEGVETKGEMETLINLGVDYMQGYYISKPSFIPEDISDKIKKELKICHENRNDVV